MDSWIGRRVLRIPEVTTRTGLSRSSINRKWDVTSAYYDANFPPKLKLSARAIGVDEASLDQWLSALTQRDEGN